MFFNYNYSSVSNSTLVIAWSAFNAHLIFNPSLCKLFAKTSILRFLGNKSGGYFNCQYSDSSVCMLQIFSFLLQKKSVTIKEIKVVPVRLPQLFFRVPSWTRTGISAVVFYFLSAFGHQTFLSVIFN